MLYLETVSPTRDQPLSLASNLRELTQKPMQEQARWENRGSGAAPPDALPNSESRRTEKSDSRPASAATRRLRRRSQLCKRCAALVRQRSLVNSWQRLQRIGRSLLRGKNLLHQRFETRIATERVE